MTIPQIFLLVGLANAVVAFYIFMLVPEYLLRFVAWVRRAGLPLQGAGRRTHSGAGRGHHRVQPRELCRRRAADGGQPPAHPFRHGPPHLQAAGAGRAVQAGQGHPRGAAKGRPAVYEAAFERAAQVLRDGDLLAIFPEGGITKDGQLQPFKAGI
jgi:hypothetical protein